MKAKAAERGRAHSQNTFLASRSALSKERKKVNP